MVPIIGKANLRVEETSPWYKKYKQERYVPVHYAVERVKMGAVPLSEAHDRKRALPAFHLFL